MMERISIANPVFNGNEKKYLNECIDTGWVSANGRFVTEFEKKFAEFCGAKFALSCANGTVSLHLALLSLGVGAGDEVIIPTLTYIATANCVKYCGAKPVFADCDKYTLNIDPLDIEKRITSKTKAIMPVHLYGLPCDMDAIRKIAEKHNLFIVEDAAEALGAKAGDKNVGTMSDVASFSLFGNKIITSGEGGMVVTDNESLYQKMKLLKGQGMSATKRYWHEVVGYNYRMTNMQAALGLGQLEKIDWHLGERQRVAETYKKYIGNCNFGRMQMVPEGYTSVFWMNTFILADNVMQSRDEIMAKMEEKNVEMRPVFYPMHIMPPYYDACLSLPISEKVAARGINLPSHALLTENNIKYVCECLEEVIVNG